MSIDRRRLLAGSAMLVGASVVPVNEISAQAVPSLVDRELQRVMEIATGAGILGPQVAGARQRAASALDLAEVVEKSLARGVEDEDAANLASRAGLLLSELTREQRDAVDFIASGATIASTKYAYSKELKVEYGRLFRNAQITPSASSELTRAATFIRSPGPKSRYKDVEADTGVPWFVVGALHYREANLNFMGHLHCGDPLLIQTVHVPAKRPPKPWPPNGVTDPRVLWRISAKDALKELSQKITDWTVETMCYGFESFNGFGCREHHINSPYLWNYTNWYGRGGFPRDYVFSPDYRSKQAGVMAILSRLKQLEPSLELRFAA